MTSIGFPTVSPLPLSFFLTEALVMTSVSTSSLWDDDLVKGLLTLVLAAAIGEGKYNVLPFLAVILAEGTSSSSGVG
jgi:hypothetical protein